MTCRDLRFTWQVVMNRANNVVTQDGYRDIKDIDCSDPPVAVVRMKKIYAPYLQQLWGVNGNAAILPAHLLEKLNDARGSFKTAPYQSAPVGSGPFAFVRWDRGSEVVMKAFDGFFLGKPKALLPTRTRGVQRRLEGLRAVAGDFSLLGSVELFDIERLR